MISIFIFYIFSASMIIFYGVGVNRIITIKKSPREFFRSVLRVLVLSLLTTVSSYGACRLILRPFNIFELFPLITVLFFCGISFACYYLLPSDNSDVIEGYTVPLLIVLLSLSEGFSLLDCILINLSCIISFYCFVALIYSLKRRFSHYSFEKGLKPYSLLLLSISIIAIALYSWNASWLTFGLKANL